MHYKNGREAKIGDQITGRDHSGNVIAGTVVSISPGSTTCNIHIVPAGAPTWCLTASNCLHSDDALGAKPA